MISDFTIIEYLNLYDWLVFFAVLFITFLSVLWGHKKKKELSPDVQLSPLELLLMGRSLTLPVFVATLVATWYGGIFGVTALTFEKGIYNFVTQGVFWYGSYLIFAFYLVKKIRNYDVMTIPELAGRLFGTRAQNLTAGLNFLNLLPLAYTISLGIFLKSLFGGSLFINTSAGVLIVTLWSLWGGFRAVVYSDIVQFFFMMIAVILVVLFAWASLGSPIDLLVQLPPTHLDWTGGEHMSTLLVWGFIALSTLIDPNFYQRVLAADSEKTAKIGIVLSTVVWFIFDCFTTLGALYARVALPNAKPENAYLQFSMQIVPNGVRGLILAGILAIILSTLDAYLFNAATCISYDVFKLKTKFRLWHHHLALVIVAALSVLLSMQFNGRVIDVWKTMGSFSAACLLFPLLLGQWRPGIISERSFCWAVCLGCLGIVSWKIFNKIYNFSTLDEFYIGLLLTTVPLIPSLMKKKS
jgi:SSS family solute:Na+ symporter